MKGHRQTQFRDSKSGQFTTEKYANKHPATTEKQHILHPALKPTKR